MPRTDYSTYQVRKPLATAISRFARHMGFSVSGLIRMAVIFFEKDGLDAYLRDFGAGKLDIESLESNFIKKYGR
jgi:hypothetical protein